MEKEMKIAISDKAEEMFYQCRKEVMSNEPYDSDCVGADYSDDFEFKNNTYTIVVKCFWGRTNWCEVMVKGFDSFTLHI